MQIRKNAKVVCVVLAIAVWVLSTTPVFAQRETTTRVKFPKGRTSTILKGGIVRGEVHNYILGAKEGQAMTVHITSPEKNAVFTIYFSGKQESLEGASEVKDWQGVLPADNDYVIEVGSSRGNASFTLEVNIR